MLLCLGLFAFTLSSSGNPPKKDPGDIQVDWLGGGRAGGAEWIVARPEYRESGRVVSGALWGIESQGEQVFRVLGVGLGKRFGHRIARIGDVDGDGCSDFAVSSFGGGWQEARDQTEFRVLRVPPMRPVQHLGSVRCCSGRDGRTLISAEGWGRIDVLGTRDLHLLDRFRGAFEPSLERFGGPLGLSLAFLRDLDGNGADELIASTYFGGVAFAWGGSIASSTRLDCGDVGEDGSATCGLGSTCAIVGDVDEDGRLDFVLGCRADWPRTDEKRARSTLFSGCELRRIAFLEDEGTQTTVAGGRVAPWDNLIGFPAAERVFLVREAAWKDALGSVTLEQLAAVELALD